MLPTNFSVHLVDGFPVSEEKIKMLTDDGRQVMAKISHCLWQAELIKIFRFDFETV
jgi:hypothetical protein